MIAKIYTGANVGMQIEKVSIEVDVSGGLPDLRIVGLPDLVVRESKDRVRSAIRNSGYEFPMRRIVVNLAPGNIRKEGAFFDLPIAIGILKATGQIKNATLDNFLFFGELSLDGLLRKINGVLPIALHFFEQDYSFIVPSFNAKEIELTGKKSMLFYDLKQVVNYLNNNHIMMEENIVDLDVLRKVGNNSYGFDFKNVKGQIAAKRAIEIAVAGGHNILLKGSPGTGKTMLAKCIPSILPDLDLEECLEITKIYSIAGELGEDMPIFNHHPFRNPHHSTSRASMIGGGNIPKPGEVSLSHLGVLFLDEIPEFSRNVLESLREPLEDGEVTISRINAKIKYPADFMLVASMNPCPCGYLGSARQNCICSDYQINRYVNKISGPLMDRIDLIVNSEEVKYDDLHNAKKEECSKEIKERVTVARKRQKERLINKNIKLNGSMSKKEISRDCCLDKEGEELLKIAYLNLGLSVRAHDKILKVARTIADLKGNSRINSEDLAEAIQYRG